MNEYEKKLQELKKLDLSKFHASLWVVHRKLRGSTAEYHVAFVKIEQKLREKLVNIVDQKIRTSNSAAEYQFISEDQDDGQTLAVDLAATDLDAIIGQMGNATNAEAITSPDQLFDSWAYLIDLKDTGKRVTALHKIPDGWRLKQKERGLNVIFKDRVLLDIEDEQIFRLERAVDCFAYEGLVFILDKKKFERALNFRAGMEKNVKEVLGEFEKLGILTDVGILRDKVGTKLPYLRRVSMIHKNGYFRQPGYIARVKSVCKKRGWPVKFDGSKIVVTVDNVDLVLTLLNNDRLESPVNAELFDVLVKHKVT